MAKKETNDAKRMEMKALVEAAVAKGWTQAMLAGFFGYTSFSPFAKGSSMGTNELRAQLRQIETPAAYAHLIAARVSRLRDAVAKCEVELAKQRARQPLDEAQWRNGPMKQYIEKYPESYTYAKYLEQEVAGQAWSINRALNNLKNNQKWLNALVKTFGSKE